jgi:ribosomal protein L7/L12
MHTNNPHPRLDQLCSSRSRPQTAGVVFGCVAGALACTGILYLLMWWADDFPLLPGPPAMGPWPRLMVSAFIGTVATIGAIVATRSQKARRLRQAERLAESGDQIRAARVLQRATGLGLEECAGAIQAYVAGRRSSSAPPALPEEVRRLAEAGEQLRAVQRLRELTGLELPEAMQLVEKHLGVRPWWQDLADDPGQKIEAIAAYREEHGVELAEAKRAVEEYINERGNRA